MNKINIGLSFLIIASIFYSTQFICGAIGAIGATEWSKEEFANYMSYVPNSLIIANIIAFVLGIAFFVWGFINTYYQK